MTIMVTEPLSHIGAMHTIRNMGVNDEPLFIYNLIGRDAIAIHHKYIR